MGFKYILINVDVALEKLYGLMVHNGSLSE